ncbi:hypothetical protein LINPERHAP1_LOCUS8173, partial [Linum perenne]
GEQAEAERAVPAVHRRPGAGRDTVSEIRKRGGAVRVDGSEADDEGTERGGGDGAVEGGDRRGEAQCLAGGRRSTALNPVGSGSASRTWMTRLWRWL